MTPMLGSTHDSGAIAGDVDAFVRTVRSGVDARLTRFFADKRVETERISPRSLELVAALESLTMRGGKRLRPVVTAAAMLAVDPKASLDSMVDAGAALELLQTYLLAHDDFMDGDLERRGGPAVHAIFRDRYRDAHLGDSLGVLAGDLASAYSLELVLAAPLGPDRMRLVIEAFLTLRKEVYFGQHLDVVGDADVARMHDLKTGSYTVRGPARIGGLLGDASERELGILRGWADPLGEAFQLADDLLGTFGDAKETGKPGEDLRHGKRTSLIVEAESRLSPSNLGLLRTVLGEHDAPVESVSTVMRMLETEGVRQAVEDRATACLASSESALRAGAGLLDARGIERLSAIGRRLAVRAS